MGKVSSGCFWCWGQEVGRLLGAGDMQRERSVWGAFLSSGGGLGGETLLNGKVRLDLRFVSVGDGIGGG